MARVKSPRRGPYRKFGSLRILRDGRIRFSAWTLPGLPQLDFTAIHGEHYNSGRYSISANWRGQPMFLIYLARHRVESTCFAFTLSPDELRSAVAVLRNAGNGIERWITAGLEWTQAALGDRPEIQKVISALLESCRDLPVAAQWKKVRANVFANAEKARAPA